MKLTLCFLILPVVTVGMNLGNIRDINTLIGYVLFVIINLLFSWTIFLVVDKIYKNIKVCKCILLWIAIFGAGVDQLLKLVVDNCKLDFKVVGNLFRIEQTKNLHQTAAFNYFDLEFSTFSIIIFKSITVIVIVLLLVNMKNVKINMQYAFILILAAAIANLLDSIFWGYTLDYFYFNELTCYDLKDFYVDAAIGMIIMEVFFCEKKEQWVIEQ